ncbi:rho guanine nucleotide exchange factor 3 [Orussus abietinus]|uniref:rho guanine nucleotide exchange factor 3 n=1 Tax=Orussus abietinus TaxID=222816 RepID=UPI0006263C87|nr:rho guanine nucleotide exchange factor 3 [Orussus abietinus]
MSDNRDSTEKDVFQEPKKRFWLRTRKRRKSETNSITSEDISIESSSQKKKKKRRISEVIGNFVASSTLDMSRYGNLLDRSFSIRENSLDASIAGEGSHTATLSKKSKRNKRCAEAVPIRSWVTDIAKQPIGCRKLNLSRSEAKRQEVIYELYCGENTLLNDLYMLRDSYYKPLLVSGIFTTSELDTLFSDLPGLIQIHTTLRDQLSDLRDQFGFTENIGPTIINWIPSLTDPYIQRCKSLVSARQLLEEKKAISKRFQDFLKKRLDSPRSVELWTYIDTPRTRIVKYPLLINEILRHTPSYHSDHALLKEAAEMLTDLLKNIDQAMGHAECKLAQKRILKTCNYDSTDCIRTATVIITEGLLKDLRGTKFQCFLFDTCFVLTRPTRKHRGKCRTMFPVIPTKGMQVHIDENVPSTCFRIGDHVLTVEDQHKRKHWLDAFNRAIETATQHVKNVCENLNSETITENALASACLQNPVHNEIDLSCYSFIDEDSSIKVK